MLKSDKIIELTGNHSISAKPETLEVYTFSGEGSSFDILPMKQKGKSTKSVTKYPFQFFELNHTVTKSDKNLILN